MSFMNFLVAQVLKKPNVKGVSQETIPKDEVYVLSDCLYVCMYICVYV